MRRSPCRAVCLQVMEVQYIQTTTIHGFIVVWIFRNANPHHVSSRKNKRSCVKLNAKQIQFHTLRYWTTNLFDSHKDVMEPHRNSCPLLARCCSMDNPARCGRVCCAEQLRAVSFRGVGKGICCTRKCWEPVHLWFHWVKIRRSNSPNYYGCQI